MHHDVRKPRTVGGRKVREHNQAAEADLRVAGILLSEDGGFRVGVAIDSAFAIASPRCSPAAQRAELIEDLLLLHAVAIDGPYDRQVVSGIVAPELWMAPKPARRVAPSHLD
jgi:hypothetical protein